MMETEQTNRIRHNIDAAFCYKANRTIPHSSFLFPENETRNTIIFI